MEFIKIINTNQGFFMVLLTLFYVIATIIICIYNHRSAKATSNQTKELIRQFEEQNRPYIIITMQKLKNGLLTLCIENIGKKLANNITININKEFLNSLSDELAKRNMAKLLDSHFNLGIQQKFYIYLNVCHKIKEMNVPLLLHVSYSDDKRKYEDSITIDFDQYHWILLNDSDITDIRDSLSKANDINKSINKNLMLIAEKLSGEKTNAK